MLHSVRLLPFETLPAAENMAADEVLLDYALTHGRAALRFYAWAEPSLSLGYFQTAASRLTDPKRAKLPWVRRATGGAALVHHHETTYALAMPPTCEWKLPTGDSWICRFHKIITQALKIAGAETRSVACDEEKKLGEVLCFLHQTTGDLTAASAKVVGSAQRKQKGAILQHGGILLSQSEFAPELLGIKELTGINLTKERTAELVAEQFTLSTGMRLLTEGWTEAELVERERIVERRYGNKDWNEKR